MGTFREICKQVKSIGHKYGFLFKHEEEVRGYKGEIFIKGYEEGKLVLNLYTPNVIVNTASILIARLLKDSSEPIGGITFLSLGTGGAGWDLQDPPAPTTNQTQLEAELYRKRYTGTAFINPLDGTESSEPTNIVDYSFNFLESEAVGPIVELGLFGGDATDVINTGTLVNYRTFPVINKTNSMAFTIIIRITT
jgi:hypothetical protein